MITAVVVVYNPDTVLLRESIYSYIEAVDEIIIVDNSTLSWDKHKIEHKKVSILELGGNKGIAFALNVGCTIALKNGADFILTMDQDTVYSQLIKSFPISLFNDKIMAIVPDWTGKGIKGNFFVNNAIQSGALISKEAMEAIGPFNERYFIDYVDYDYFKRGVKKGFVILQTASLMLNHKNGDKYRGKFLLFNYSYIFSSPLRLYYQTRNGLDYICKHRDYFQGIIMIKMFFKTLLISNRKLERIKYIYRGFRDWRKSKWGIYNG